MYNLATHYGLLVEGFLADQVENAEPFEGKRELRFLLVDTNCFLRIYQSPLRPILGADVGGFSIRTLTDLVNEFRNGGRLQVEYAWANADIDAAVNAGAVLVLNADQITAVQYELSFVKPFGNALLERYCTDRPKPISIKSLSTNDAKLIATAMVLEAVIATDEWPMTHVVADLIQDDEREIEIWNSFDLLNLLETHDQITPEDRRNTVKSWMRNGEALPRNWEAQYRRLFNEPAPRLQ